MAYNVSIDFNEQNLVQGLERALIAADRLDKKMDELTTSIKKSGSGSGPTDKLSDSITKSVSAADKGTQAVQKFGRSSGASFAAFNLGINVVQGLASQFTAFAGNVVTLASNFETSQATFEVFLGSTEKANKLLSELNDFAAATPFSQQQIVNVGQKLLAFGFEGDKVAGILQRLGDLSGGNAEKFSELARIFGQAKTATTVYNGDLQQLAERGIPIYDELTKITGKSVDEVKKMAEQGRITFPFLEEAFGNLTSEGGLFFGLMEKQSKTFGGLLSTLTGDFEQLQAGLGLLLIPALKELVKVADGIVKEVDVNAIGAAFSDLGDDLAPFLATLQSGLAQDVVPALKLFGSEIGEVLTSVEDFASGVNGNGEAARFLKNVIDLVTTAFAKLVNTISFSVSAVRDFVTPILTELEPALNSVIRLANGLIEAFVASGTEAEKTGSIFSSLGNVVSLLATAISITVQVVTEAVAALFGLEESARSTDPIIRKLGEAFDFLTAPARFRTKAISTLTESIAEFLGITEDSSKAAKILADEVVAGSDEIALYYKLREENEAKPTVVTEKKKPLSTEKKKTQEQIRKELETAEKERQKIELDLIEDSTQKLLQAERNRYAEQLKDIKTYSKDKNDLNEKNAIAIRIHTNNLAEIQAEADEKTKGALGKTLARERKFIEEREDLRKDILVNTAQKEKTLSDIQLDIAEATFSGIILRMQQSGATEAEIQKKQLDFDLVLKKIRLQKEIEFQSSLLSATNSGNTAMIEVLTKNIELLKKQAENVDIEIEISAGAPGQIDKGFLRDILNLKESIAAALDIPAGDIDKRLSEVQSAFSTIFSSISDISQVQIDQNEELIKSLDGRIAKQEELLDKERDLKERGLANSLKAEEDTLNALLKQREDAEKRTQELQQKSVRQQIVLDTAQQASGVATSVVNIIKDSSKIPFIGILLAAIQVASLFALLSSARQRFKSTRLKDGGELPPWKTDEDGHEGYQIEDTGIMVGGGEYIVRRPVTRKHRTFLSRLNAGEYDNIDIVEMLKGGNGVRAVKFTQQRELFAYHKSDRVTQPGAGASQVDLTEQTKQIVAAIEIQTNRLIRQGFAKLMELGDRIVDKDGNVVHFSIDPSGNTSRKKTNQ